MYSRLLIRTSAAVAAAALLIGCDRDARAEKDDQAEAPPIPVEVHATIRGDISAVYTGTAAFEAEREAEVVAKVAGEVIEILVEEGDRVDKDQLLARLDGDRLRLELAQTRANRDKLEQDYRRQQQLLQRGLLSTEAVESLKFDLAAIRANHDLAALEYSYTEIRAPIKGVVAERAIKVGNTIAVNAITFRIADNDPLVAYLYVPEKDYSKIAPDQIASVQVDALGGDTFNARVARISPTVDSATGTFKATLELNDPGGRLRPGMFGRFAVVYDSRPQALLIPRMALLDTGSGSAVFVVKDGVAARRNVQTGFSSQENVEITAGLEDGDQVVTVGQSGLKDGSQVRIVDTATG